MIQRGIENSTRVNGAVIERLLTESCEYAQKFLDKTSNTAQLAGTTYVSVLIWNKWKAFFSNAGDSRAFLASTSKKGNKVECRLTTDDHKPENPQEKKRIEKAGGVVMTLKDDDGSDFGPARVWNKEMTAPGLAMSRSIGDSYAHSFGVIATPDHKQIELNSDDKFIFLASDGVFEFLDNSYCIKKIQHYYAKDDKETACKKLVKRSIKEWKEVCLFLK